MKEAIIYRVPSPYDANKIYLIKKYPCGHYYMNQEICGRIFYKKYIKTTKRWIEEIFK